MSIGLTPYQQSENDWHEAKKEQREADEETLDPEIAFLASALNSAPPELRAYLLHQMDKAFQENMNFFAKDADDSAT